jgi:hypothetical protein
MVVDPEALGQREMWVIAANNNINSIAYRRCTMSRKFHPICGTYPKESRVTSFAQLTVRPEISDPRTAKSLTHT